MARDVNKQARTEAILGELTELGLVVARELAVRLGESEDVGDTVALAGAFEKMSRGVRLTLALDAKLEREAARDVAAEALDAETKAQADAQTQAEAEAARADERRREDARAAKASAPADPIEMRKDRVRGLMKRLLWTESEGDEQDYEMLVEDLDARLDEAARHPDFEALPIETLARRLIADMRLTGDFALTLGEPKTAPAREPQMADTG